jgi:hypothetical protein
MQVTFLHTCVAEIHVYLNEHTCKKIKRNEISTKMSLPKLIHVAYNNEQLYNKKYRYVHKHYVVY